MTDREMLELAAKVAGLQHHDGWDWITNHLGYKWNPLEDDGDALRLVVNLNIPVFPYDNETSTGTVGVVAKKLWKQRG